MSPFTARAEQGGTTADPSDLVRAGKKFSLIYADPPWEFKVYSGKGKQRSAERYYDTQSLDAIKALPVACVASACRGACAASAANRIPNRSSGDRSSWHVHDFPIHAPAIFRRRQHLACRGNSGGNERDNRVLYRELVCLILYRRGASFTFVDPYTQFGPLDGGFCCDQTVIYDQTRDLMIWQLQYNFDQSTGKGSYRIAFANAASVESAGWCVYEFNPGDFGFDLSQDLLSIDRPAVALSSNFVWYTANIYSEPDGPFQQTVMWRIPLDVAANCPSRAFDYFRDTQFHFTPVEGATDTMYWARIGTIPTGSIRIYQWAEADSMPSSTDVTISAWPDNRPRLCPGPDGLNWCAGADKRQAAGWISNGVIGFMWTASQGTGDLGDFPYPYVHVARFNASTKALIDEPIIWNATGAWAYPALGVNDRGDIGGTLYFGGGANFPMMTALIMDDLSPAPLPPWEVYGFSGSTEGADRWGDYYSSRRNISGGTTWVITGQNLEAGLVQAWYVWMGRSRDAPPTEMSSSGGVQGTPPTSASSDFLRFWWDDISRQRRSP